MSKNPNQVTVYYNKTRQFKRTRDYCKLICYFLSFDSVYYAGVERTLRMTRRKMS